MPRRTDIKSILIIGAGPIVIGQACEFDYSGTQGCYALGGEGYEVILVNSNPATIMTDPTMAKKTYIEPITPEIVEQIIIKERPDAILPTLGGQTALNCALQLDAMGVLSKYKVEVLGSSIEAIKNAEDRSLFKDIAHRAGLKTPRSFMAKSLSAVEGIVKAIGFPVVVRSSFTLGGVGSGIAHNFQELESILSSAPGVFSSGVQIDQSLIGWKEYEMEVMCDLDQNCMLVCAIENIDPMGVHTGDSITVAPSMTLSDKEYQAMRNASFAVMKGIGIKAGGVNVQFAINPTNGEMLVIEANPRVSRSSALASKATGFPIAYVAAKLAVGYRLHEIQSECIKVPAPVKDEAKNAKASGRFAVASDDNREYIPTPVCIEPSLDYVVIKIPRFNFDKFPGIQPLITTSMKSVGEVMAIGRCFNEALQKGMISLEEGLSGINEAVQLFCDTSWPAVDFADLDRKEQKKLRNFALAELSKPTIYRLRIIADALRFGIEAESIVDIAQYDPWFVEQLRRIVELEKYMIDLGMPEERKEMLHIKKQGFSDARIAELASRRHSAITAADVANKRKELGVNAVYKNIDTCAAEFDSFTAYMYSCYEDDAYSCNKEGRPSECESIVTKRPKVIILGSGPNRIGQGIEFDYACSQACIALRGMGLGIDIIMVNCNPETVSTDYRLSDKLYFEPLSLEHVLNVVNKEKETGFLLGVVTQLGGQTPLKLMKGLVNGGVNILGTDLASVDICEDRGKFRELISELGLQQPQGLICNTAEEVLVGAKELGFPILIRPSYVLGGFRMSVVNNAEELQDYLDKNLSDLSGLSLLLDRFLSGATELDVDAVADGQNVVVVGMVEHIEDAGVHSGDSCCVMPPHSLSQEMIETIKAQTTLLGQRLKIKGLLNVQYAIKDGMPYVLEVNPRASRTIPFVDKALGFNMVDAAMKFMLDAKAHESMHYTMEPEHDPVTNEIVSLNIRMPRLKIPDFSQMKHFAVKRPVFSSSRFPGANTVLRPEMKSTGEVMAIDRSFAAALMKSYLAVGNKPPKRGGAVLISVKDEDKAAAAEIAKNFIELGFDILATAGTANYLKDNGIAVGTVERAGGKRPNVTDLLLENRICYALSTTNNYDSLIDELSMRRILLTTNIPYAMTIKEAAAFVRALREIGSEPEFTIKALQDSMT